MKQEDTYSEVLSGQQTLANMQQSICKQIQRNTEDMSMKEFCTCKITQFFVCTNRNM